MADQSIKQFAESIGRKPEELLNQFKAAGVDVTHVDQTVNEEEKKKLLSYLKPERSPITLKHKQYDVLKQGKKSINITTVRSRRILKPVAAPTVEIEEAKDQQESETIESVVVEAPEIQPEIPETKKVQASPESPAKESLQTEQSTARKPKEVAVELSHKTEKRFKPTPKPEEKELSQKSRKKGRARVREPEDQWEQSELHLLPRTLEERSVKKKPVPKGAPLNRSALAKLEQSFAKPVAPMILEVSIPESITVADLAKKMSVKAAQVIKVMINMGVMATINQPIDQETAAIIVQEMGHKPKLIKADALEASLIESIPASEVAWVPRAPVVTIMGHVDHGKTSLLDYIRRTKVTSTEAGGITQHIGAYHVETSKGMVTFLDTPGHEAFTAMRARGVKYTDIVVLVVAADDGVMPQTIEAIQHARAAQVAIIVAVNKIDKPEADPERIKTELSKQDILSEEWGGDVMFQNISARTGEGIDDLLDRILLQAEILSLKAPNKGSAKGVVIESRLDKGRGPVATILVMQGELSVGNILIVGREYGRIRAMIGDDGKPKKEAGPSMPVEVLGLSSTPNAGDEAIVVADERKAREITQFRQGKYRETRIAKKQTAQLSSIFDHLSTGQQNTLNVVLKTDVQGSLEAITDALTKLSTSEVKVNVVAASVGGITESDVNLAIASHAIVVGFNVRANQASRALVEKEGVDLRYYSVIYNIIEEVKKALSGLLAPQFEEKVIGLADVREVFRSSKVGAIAGCLVTEGVIRRRAPIRVLRDSVVVHEGELESLRRYKDDASEVRSGLECGMGIKNYNDIKVGDQIEAYEKIKVERQLA